MIVKRKKRSRLSSTVTKFGALETKKAALSRLQELKTKKTTIEQMKNEIDSITGNEYFFKMHSTHKSNGKLHQKQKLTKDNIKKYINRLTYEITIQQNKIKKYTQPQNNIKIIFGDDNSEKIHKVEHRIEPSNSLIEELDKLEQLKEYKNKLQAKLKEIEE